MNGHHQQPQQPQTDQSKQQYCLKWNNHQTNLQRVFSRLLRSEIFTDVTIACDGRSLQAHKLVLSACSSYFEQLFMVHADKSPLVILRDISYDDMRAIIDFMYNGEINVSQEQLSSLINTADALKVKGLAEVSNGSNSGSGSIPKDSSSSSSPAPVSTPLPSSSVLPPASQSVPAAASVPTGVASKNKSVPSSSSTAPGPIPGSIPLSLLAPGAAAAAAGGSSTGKSADLLQQGRQRSQVSQSASPQSSMLNILSKTMAHMSAWSNQQQQQQCKQQQQCDTSAAQQIEESGGSRDVPDGFEDVCQLDDYLATGMSRESYWKMETTRQVLTAVRDHRLDMKLGAKLLGVSYNTIYGRYREAYGSLTESPGSSAAASSAVAVAVANTGGSQKTGDKKLEIVKMNHFVNQGGARMAFWDLPSTKHVLEAIRDKSMELKHAAEVLGVSYGTLYGRYRENYGYLKASWKQQTSGVRKSSSSSGSLWEEPETLELLRRLSVGEVTMDQVAERLSVDYYVLQYQLSLMELTLPFSAQQKVPQSGTKRPAFLQEGPGGKMARIANGLEADDVIGLDDSVEEAQELPQEEDEVDDEELQLKIVEADQLDDPLSHQSSSPHSQLV